MASEIPRPLLNPKCKASLFMFDILVQGDGISMNRDRSQQLNEEQTSDCTIIIIHRVYPLDTDDRKVRLK